MKNFVSNGNSLQVAAPEDGVIGGDLFKHGDLIGVVVATAAEDEQFTLMIKGVFGDVPKATGEAWTAGTKVYLKADGSSLTTTATSNAFAGYAAEDAATGDTTGSILLGN